MKEEATLSDFVDEIATQVCEVYQKYQLTQSSQFEHFQSLRMLDKIKCVTPCLTHTEFAGLQRDLLRQRIQDLFIRLRR